MGSPPHIPTLTVIDLVSSLASFPISFFSYIFHSLCFFLHRECSLALTTSVGTFRKEPSHGFLSPSQWHACPMFLDHATICLSLRLCVSHSALNEISSLPLALCMFVLPTQHCSPSYVCPCYFLTKDCRIRDFSVLSGFWDSLLYFPPIGSFFSTLYVSGVDSEILLLSQSHLKCSILNIACTPQPDIISLFKSPLHSFKAHKFFFGS